MEIGTVIPVDIEEEMKGAYLDYAMSVIVSRALPDVRDGLKPVQRRILYTMHEMGLGPDKPYRKSARIVGEVLGKFHPHGDAAVYDAMARMAQDFTLRYPLVDGQGNFGSIDGDPPAAMRYCVTGDTLIATEQGLIRIEDIVPGSPDSSEHEVRLGVLTHEGKFASADRFFNSGRHPTIRVETEIGLGFAGTYQHPVLTWTRDGNGRPTLAWKLLKDLRPGDWLVVHPGGLAGAVRVRIQETNFVPFLAEYLSSRYRGRGRNEWLGKHNLNRYERLEAYWPQLKEFLEPEDRALVAWLLSQRYYFARVSALRYNGIETVYSLRVPGPNSFVGNGFIHHNTEARLTPIAMEMLADIEKETVDFTDNFDGSLKEPTVLPARLPNLLINGSSGIAVGMATSIPPHNLKEVASAIAFVVDNYQKFDEISLEDLMKFIKGPDFPTGGIVLGYEGLKAAYATGKGIITVRALTRIEEIKGGRYAIIVTQIPYQINKSSLLERIAELVRSGRLEEIADLRDESDREGMSIVIELKRGVEPRTALLKLFKYTPLQVTFGINMLALVDGEPVLLSLKELIKHYIEHRKNVITRRARYDLEKARHRVHILEGLLVALANLDEVVQIIRGSRTPETALKKLMERFKLTQIQAQAILDMPLRRLVALERQKLQEEHKELTRTIKSLEQLLKYPRKILELIKQEALELAQKYGDSRRTQVLPEEAEILTEEDLVAREELLISITGRGFVHRASFRSCRASRNGRESLALEIAEGDSLALSLKAESIDQVLVLSDKGRLYSFRPYQIEGRFSLPLDAGERPAAAIALPPGLSGGYLAIFTEQGKVKRVELDKIMPVRSSGLGVIKLEGEDRPVALSLAGEEDELFMVTAGGLALRFPASEVRPMGRDAAGVLGIKLKERDRVVGAGTVKPDGFLLILTDKGFVKRVAFSLFPSQHRYGQGVVASGGKAERIGSIVAALALCPQDEFLAFSERGRIWRVKAEEVPSKSRPAVPEALIALGKGEKVKGAGVAYGRLGPCSG